jgi:hypothetical protein
MRFYRLGGAILALTLAFGSQAVPAVAADTPKATEMIFDHKHLANVETGKEIVYKFNRTVTDPQILGQPFSDDITLKVVADAPDGHKNVDMQIYTGDRARDLQKLENLTVNPIYQVYFAQAVNSFSMLAGGKTPYLQRVFSLALKDKTKVEPIKVDYKGKQIDAYRISMTPYVGDQYESKMQGWEGAKYDIVVSNQVPGEVVDLVATYQNRYPPAKMKLVERTTLDGVTGLETPQ